jgi:hypothetical protein
LALDRIAQLSYYHVNHRLNEEPLRMKAEHRKELETNALADRVGRALQGMKQRPQKRTFVWFVVAVIVVAFGLLFYRYQINQRADRSKQWLMLDFGAPELIKQLAENRGETMPGKGATYEYSFFAYRLANALMARDPKSFQDEMDTLQRMYEKLASQCKEDKVLSAEAMFAQAVIAETLIIKNDANVRSAQEAYQAVVDKHKDSAFGKKAAKRLETFTDEAKKKDMLETYRELRREFNLDERPPFLDQPLTPPLKAPDLPLIPK